MSTPIRSEAEAERRYQALLRELRGELPGFRLLRRRAAIHRLVLQRFNITIGQRVYVTDDWDRLPAGTRYATLRHEAVHLRQFRRYGFVLMALLYLLVPLPVGLAYFRMRLEREAYAETLRVTYELGGAAALRDPALRRHVLSQFSSAAYGYMWPFPTAMGRWYDALVAELLETAQA